MEIKKEKTITETKRICDFCKKGITHRICNGCKKDICCNCIKSWDSTYSDDYLDKFCERCTNIRSSYKSEIYNLQEKINKLQDKCDSECLSKETNE